MLTEAAEAVRPALRAFVRTLLACAAGALLLAVVGYLVAARGWVARGMLGALIAFALAVPVAALLSWRAAIAAGATTLAGKLGAAGKLVRTLFERIPKAVTSAAELEAALRAAARGFVAGDDGGPMRRAIELRVLRAVERLSVAAIPRDGAIDVARLREDLAARADAAVAERIGRAIRGGSLLIAAAVAAAAIAAAWALRTFS